MIIPHEDKLQFTNAVIREATRLRDISREASVACKLLPKEVMLLTEDGMQKILDAFPPTDDETLKHWMDYFKNYDSTYFDS